MDKKEEFKSFVKNKPELVKYIKSGEMTWQKFYEIYDLYGEDESVWSSYKDERKSSNSSSGLNTISNIVKNIDVESIQKHINTAQKALGLVEELTSKGSSSLGASEALKTNIEPRPINKFFED